MTDPTALVDAVRRVAEAAGYKLHYSRNMEDTERYYFIYEKNPSGVLRRVMLPGASGSLEGECEVVLGWLAKAGYMPQISSLDDLDTEQTGFGVFLYAKSDKPEWTGHGDTLHEALAAALLAMPG